MMVVHPLSYHGGRLWCRVMRYIIELFSPTSCSSKLDNYMAIIKLYPTIKLYTTIGLYHIIEAHLHGEHDDCGQPHPAVEAVQVSEALIIMSREHGFQSEHRETKRG